MIKRLFFIALVLSFSAITTQAQQITNKTDSLSQALGEDIGRSVKGLGVELNMSVLTKAIRDVIEDKQVVFGEQDAQRVISAILQAEAEKKHEKVKKEAAEFLEKNKANPGVIVHESGLQYTVLEPGNGPSPTETDEVTVHYIGKLLNGKTFDNSYDRGEPLSLSLERVIKGWQIGLPLMKTGAKYRFFVPYELGYGSRDMGEIPSYSTLIFDIELIDVVEKEVEE